MRHLYFLSYYNVEYEHLLLNKISNMSITLMDLPYSEDALEPFISKKTVFFHYHKHHAGYVKNLNNLIKDTELQEKSLEEIILDAYQMPKQKIFNNAAQIWNHNMMWQSLSLPSTSGEPSEQLTELIVRSFGSIESLKEKLHEAAIGHFGSGWVWLVLNKNTSKLEIMTTLNANTPLVFPNLVTLFTIDVWEHAYYIDYQNLRPDYIKSLIENIINWTYINMQFTL
ncbi:MAG: superoxide dismutase [Candidatus Xenolissoclinum pacificiensis L6]|uniref:Superoxide dismutase n=1 Tax=Candidatus Xenolissoclinum pacificiensis L6 TaxID=1401685 RepID=W2UYQ9_9RICK|nr:MAG: superoxide dismutase [Candidatus Xenolissoclinum pacificiensis L6]